MAKYGEHSSTWGPGQTGGAGQPLAGTAGSWGGGGEPGGGHKDSQGEKDHRGSLLLVHRHLQDPPSRNIRVGRLTNTEAHRGPPHRTAMHRSTCVQVRSVGAQVTPTQNMCTSRLRHAHGQWWAGNCTRPGTELGSCPPAH